MFSLLQNWFNNSMAIQPSNINLNLHVSQINLNLLQIPVIQPSHDRRKLEFVFIRPHTYHTCAIGQIHKKFMDGLVLIEHWTTSQSSPTIISKCSGCWLHNSNEIDSSTPTCIFSIDISKLGIIENTKRFPGDSMSRLLPVPFYHINKHLMPHLDQAIASEIPFSCMPVSLP